MKDFDPILARRDRSCSTTENRRCLNFTVKKNKLMKQSRAAIKFLTVFSDHVTYVFYSECTLSSCLNVNEFLARKRRDF